MGFKKYLHIEKNQINPSYSFNFTVQYVRDNAYRKSYTQVDTSTITALGT